MNKPENHNFARGDPFEEIAAAFEGSGFTRYGAATNDPFIEFDLHLDGPDRGKFSITGTVEQVKTQLLSILERFGPKTTKKL